MIVQVAVSGVVVQPFAPAPRAEDPGRATDAAGVQFAPIAAPQAPPSGQSGLPQALVAPGTLTGAQAAGAEGSDANPQGLTEDERRVIAELRSRDAAVRRHEQAHKAVGGRFAGAISFEFQVGPDGKRYAIGGEVSIDTTEIPDDPEATIRKMEVVRRAALAPSDPSAADRAIAAGAGQKLNEARSDLAAERTAELRERLSSDEEPVAETPAADGRAGADGTPPQTPAIAEATAGQVSDDNAGSGGATAGSVTDDAGSDGGIAGFAAASSIYGRNNQIIAGNRSGTPDTDSGFGDILPARAEISAVIA